MIDASLVASQRLYKIPKVAGVVSVRRFKAAGASFQDCLSHLFLKFKKNNVPVFQSRAVSTSTGFPNKMLAVFRNKPFA
jgi:hypothetical protein